MIDSLVLVRHGDAELFGRDGGDISRCLTEEGASLLKRDYPQTFARVRSYNDIHMWVSPALRAQQTAEIVASAVGIEPESFEVHESLYEQEDEIFLAELLAEGKGCVIAVGHIPFMQRLLFELTGCDIAFGKGAVAAISFLDEVPQHARLEWFVQGPK